MLEKILENVINEMTPHLDPEQQEHLSNVLYVNFHGKKIVEESTELAATCKLIKRKTRHFRYYII